MTSCDGVKQKYLYNCEALLKPNTNLAGQKWTYSIKAQIVHPSGKNAISQRKKFLTKKLIL